MDSMILDFWRDGWAVESGGLENRYTLAGIGGSNPPLSSILRRGYGWRSQSFKAKLISIETEKRRPD